MSVFGDNIKFLRTREGLTQKEFSARFGKNPSTVGNWEQGTRSPITKDVLKIADYYKILPVDLYSKDIRDTEDNRCVIELYTKLKPNQRKVVIEMMKSMLED